MNIDRPSPPSASLPHRRAAVLHELRRLLPGMGVTHKSLPLGLAALDACLPDGGLTCGALHEVVPAPRAIAAAFGFIAAITARLASFPPRRGEGSRTGTGTSDAGLRPPPSPRPSPCPFPRRTTAKTVLILPAYGFREYGRPHGHGLRALGLDPARLILVETAHRKETLWAIEETLRSSAARAVAAMIDRLDLKSSQRLHLAAQESGATLFLLRPAALFSTDGEWLGETSAAATRWRIGAAPAARDRFGLFARPRWHLRLERARNGRPGEWTVEYDHVAHRFSLAAALAGPACARGAEEKQRSVATRHRS